MFSSVEKYAHHIAIFSTGERFPVLLYQDTYRPVMLATRYMIDERRESKSSGTISLDIRVLKWLYEWCDVSGIPIEDRLRNGEMLTKPEILGLCRYIRAGRTKLVIGAIGVHEKKEEGSLMFLSPETFNAYVSVIERFLLWAAYEFIPIRTPENDIHETLDTAVQRIKRSFLSIRKNGHIANKRHGLDPEDVETIRKFIKPGADCNPFKKIVQFRNWLIFELMIATGVRRGELLKIKLNHLPIGSKTTLSIMKEPDDKEDPRRQEPQVKTKMREIPLPKQLRVAIWRYVKKYRRCGSTNYLFTSSRSGIPLSQGAINFIFKLLVKRCVSYLKYKLSPHVLRHTFNEMFLEEAMAQNLSEEQIRQLQCYLNGWSEQSNMPALYTQRIVEEKAMEIAERYQEKLYVF